jgi:hypothetical protein
MELPMTYPRTAFARTLAHLHRIRTLIEAEQRRSTASPLRLIRLKTLALKAQKRLANMMAGLKHADRWNDTTTARPA